MPAPCFPTGPLGWGWNPGWHLEALAHCPAQPGTQATAGQLAAGRPVQEGPPGLPPWAGMVAGSCPALPWGLGSGKGSWEEPWAPSHHSPGSWLWRERLTLRGQPGQLGTWPRPGLPWFLVWARDRAVVLGGSHLKIQNAWYWHPGGRVGLHGQLRKKLGEGDSVCPLPHLFQPCSHILSTISEPPLCSFSPLGPGWASQLALARTGGRAAPGDPPLLGTPLSELQPSLD